MKPPHLFGYPSDMYSETELVIISSPEPQEQEVKERIWPAVVKRSRLCVNPKKKGSKPQLIPLERNRRERYVEMNLIYDPTIGHWDIIYDRYMCLLASHWSHSCFTRYRLVSPAQQTHYLCPVGASNKPACSHLSPWKWCWLLQPLGSWPRERGWQWEGRNETNCNTLPSIILIWNFLQQHPSIIHFL